MTGQPSEQAKSRAPGNRAFGSVGSALRFFMNPRNVQEIPRLLHEGPAPIVRLVIQMHNTREIRRRLRLGRPVSFVSSFPRSGNTWVRYLLADVILQGQGIETSTELPVQHNKIVPDIYCNWISPRNETAPDPGLFVKTHQVFDELEEGLWGAPRARGSGGGAGAGMFHNCKFIYLYRSPDDALVSLYHYFARQKHLKAKTACGIDAFCLGRLGDWENNISSYLRAADEGAAVLFVPYELLLQYPVEILSNLLHWLGLRHDPLEVQRAVSNMEFNKLQAVEARNLIKEEAHPLFASWKIDPFAYFRLGGKGSVQAELRASTVEQIQERTAGLVTRANSRVLGQQSLQRNPAPSETRQIRWQAAMQSKPSKGLPSVPSLHRT